MSGHAAYVVSAWAAAAIILVALFVLSLHNLRQRETLLKALEEARPRRRRREEAPPAPAPTPASQISPSPVTAVREHDA